MPAIVPFVCKVRQIQQALIGALEKQKLQGDRELIEMSEQGVDTPEYKALITQQIGTMGDLSN